MATSSVSDTRQNAESRARIVARLRETKKAKGKARTLSVLSQPVLPKFVAREQGKTEAFVARAEALSCRFLTEGKTEKKTVAKVIAKSSVSKVLRDFLATRRGKKALPLLLFDVLEKSYWQRLGILKNVEGCCRPTEVCEDVEGGDFEATPFPAFSLQRAVCAIAETGTLVFANRTRAQALLTFLPTVHIVLLAERDIVGSLEQAFVRVPSSAAGLWACHLVSGPSRTADIEQKLHMGAHGPKELVVLLHR